MTERRKYIQRVVSRHGKEYFYFRHPKHRERLPGRPGSGVFEKEYARLVNRHCAKPQKALSGSFIYIIDAFGSDFCKIGNSDDPRARLRNIQTGCPAKLRICALFTVAPSKARLVEKRAHESLEPHRANGEWFLVPAHRAQEAILGAAKGQGAQLRQLDQVANLGLLVTNPTKSAA
jgi:hypothetical protein